MRRIVWWLLFETPIGDLVLWLMEAMLQLAIVPVESVG